MNDPRELVSAGDHVSVRILEVKLDKKQIALTMKSGEARSERPAAGAHPPDDGRSPPRDRGSSPPPPPPKPAPYNNPFAAALANRGKRS